MNVKFESNTRKKIIRWLFDGCQRYEIHEFHVHKAISYLLKYLVVKKVNKRKLEIAATVCIGLSLKFYEKEPVSFYDLQVIFNFIEIISEMNKMETEIIFCNDFKLLNQTHYELIGNDKKSIINYLIYFDILETISIEDLDNAINLLYNINAPYNKYAVQLANIFKYPDYSIVNNSCVPHNLTMYARAYLLKYDKLETPIELTPVPNDELKLVAYILKKKIAESTEGSIYEAETEGRRYAVKKYTTLPMEYGISAGALSDITFQRFLCHPNIMHSAGIMFANNKFSNGMQMCDMDLYTLLNKIKPLKESHPPCYFEIVKSILWDIVNAIQYLHNLNIVHCDLKPQNILITKTSNNNLSNQWNVKITDFGSARLQIFNKNYCRFDPDSGCMVCTLWYRPIDILLGDYTFTDKTDIWSLGCIFAEVATGEPLFVADTEDELIQQINNILENNMLNTDKYSIPEDLKKLILNMLAYDPCQRPTIGRVIEDPYFN